MEVIFWIYRGNGKNIINRGKNITNRGKKN
jgi:hypothetical protein